MDLSPWSSQDAFGLTFSTASPNHCIKVTVFAGKAERAGGKYDVITARAVAHLAELLKISAHLSTRKSLWVLPKGRSAEAELAEAQQAWQGAFHVERSLTDPESRIVVGTGVKAKR